MKALGFLLLIAGFLAAAYSTALDVEATRWSLFLPAAIAGIVGVAMIKRAARGDARSESVLSANRNELTESLGNIVAALDDMYARSGGVNVAALRDEIDNRLRTELRRFADARESMIHLFSLQTYADIMSEFAAGERYLNRVWSASADGYGDEAITYLRRAAGQFRHAKEQLGTATSS
jgi:predicted NBD/HSP70 family sugar kinase